MRMPPVSCAMPWKPSFFCWRPWCRISPKNSEAMGHAPGTLSAAWWPEFREDALVSDTKQMVVQVNGKLRGRFEIAADAGEDVVKEHALADENVQRFTEGKDIKKIIVVKDKLVNVVV